MSLRYRRYERIGTRYGRIVQISVILVILVSSLSVLVWNGMVRAVRDYYGVAIVSPGEAYYLWVPTKEKTAVLLHIPGEYVIDTFDTTHHYGSYSLRSVVRLDRIEKKHGDIVKRSLQSAIGMPVPFILPVSDSFAATLTGSHIEKLRRIMSPFSVWSLLPVTEKLGVFARLVPLSIHMKGLAENDIRVITLGQMNVTRKEVLPDGTVQNQLDETLLDDAVRDVFQNFSIRQENVTVTVLNAADVSGLANYAARILDHVGIHVVEVDSYQTQKGDCVIAAEPVLRDSRTVAMMTYIFGCSFRDRKLSEKSDITLIMTKR